MKQEERAKAIATAIAIATNSPLIPAAVRSGLAAAAEEIATLRRDIETLAIGFVAEATELKERIARLEHPAPGT